MLRLIPKNSYNLPTPSALDDFIGQEYQKKRFKAINSGAKAAGRVMPHYLTLGPSGCGKSAFVNAATSETSGKYHFIMCTKETTPNDIVYKIEQMEDGDTLHLEECHMLNRACQEICYSIIDRKKMPLSGEVKINSVTEQKVPDIILAFTTNTPSGLRKELKNRLIVFELETYSLEEMKAIIRQAARAMRAKLSEESVNMLAVASNRIPRDALMMILELSLICQGTLVIKENVSDLFKLRKFDESGLRYIQCKILCFLLNQPEHSAKLNTLSAMLGVDTRYIQTEVEPPLINKRFISIGNTGRKLTRKGYDFAANLDQILYQV